MTGKWEARATNPQYRSEVVMKLDMVQRGDTITGTVALIKGEQATPEFQTEVVGTWRDGTLDLKSPYGTFAMTGTLRTGRLRARVNPGVGGSSANMKPFDIIFMRAAP